MFAEKFACLKFINYYCVMDFNKKIKEKGLKKSWVAKQIGISNVLLSYYLNGTRPMPEHIEIKLKNELA